MAIIPMICQAPEDLKASKLSLELALDVHGGVTYADKCGGHICHVTEPGDEENIWWFGFDCGHCDDLSPRVIEYDRLSPGRLWT